MSENNEDRDDDVMSKLIRFYALIVILALIDTVYIALTWAQATQRTTVEFPVKVSAFVALITTLYVAYKAFRRQFLPGTLLALQLLNASAVFILEYATLYWSDSARPHACMNVALTKIDSIYFTVTTLTTVGYGDIVPVSESCRVIVSSQMILGVVFLVVILSLFISRISESRSA
jgi:voltage-gated potassium channel Kch